MTACQQFFFQGVRIDNHGVDQTLFDPFVNIHMPEVLAQDVQHRPFGLLEDLDMKILEVDDHPRVV